MIYFRTTAYDLVRVLVVLALAAASGFAQSVPRVTLEVEAPSKEELAQYRELAEKGDGDALKYLGYLYEQGVGVPQSYETALTLYKRAAANGHAGAQFGLGRLYAAGHGVERNYDTAVKWLTLAAEQGEAAAMRALAILSIEGLGTGSNYDLAHQWFQKAAALGDAMAMAQLGVLYEQGLGVVADLDTAVAWYQRAIDAGDPHAALNMGRMYVRRGEVARGISMIRGAAERGQADAAYLLAGAYASGDKVEPNLVEALTWLIVAEDRDPDPDERPYQRQRDALHAAMNPAQRKLAEDRAAALIATFRWRK